MFPSLTAHDIDGHIGPRPVTSVSKTVLVTSMPNNASKSVPFEPISCAMAVSRFVRNFTDNCCTIIVYYVITLSPVDSADAD